MDKRKVAIIGCGITKFGEHWSKGLRDLAVEAGTKAMLDSGIEGCQIEEIYGGNMSAGRFIGQEHIGALIADQCGLTNIPATRVEGACASGSMAVRQAFLSVLSGRACVIAGGIEKMTDLRTSKVATTLGGAGDQEWESFIGATFPALYALMARRHMYKFGTTEEQLAKISVKNHKNAVDNEIAQYQKEITVDQVLNSAKVADPLKLLDCSPITDGAATVILASEEFVRKNKIEDPVWIVASMQASDTLALHDRKCLTELMATKVAAKLAYDRIGITPKQIDVAEVHDCFTIAEAMAYEDLGFVKKGEAGKAIDEGLFEKNSKISVNTSGGLKACGHPVGATGIKQIIEIVNQLKGKCGKRQVDKAETGLAHNVGGTGATALVHILRR